MTKENWEEIYKRGEQFNRYPYEFIVSNFYHYIKSKKTPIKVLDLGCGAGNHSLFCAQNGCNVVAVDYSVSALNEVSSRAENMELASQIRTMQADLENFSIEEGDFDLIIDRLSISNIPRKSAAQLFSSLFDTMASDGILLSCLFSDKHKHKDFGEYDKNKDVWTNFKGGIFEHLLASSFYSEEEVRAMFEKYQLVSLCREHNQELESSFADTELWKIVARKV